MRFELMTWAATRALICTAAVISGLLLAGCGGGADQTKAAQEAEELARLRQENDELKRLKAENRELDRLRRDNEEIQKLRGNQEEIARIRKENETLQQQIAGAKSQAAAARSASLAQTAASGAAPLGRDPVTGQPLPPQTLQAQVSNDPNVPQEHDELFVDPKDLKLLLPGFDWEKLKRTEPLSVRGLLEQNGIVLTNYQQLVGFGITNYQIRRNPPPPAAQEQPK